MKNYREKLWVVRKKGKLELFFAEMYLFEGALTSTTLVMKEWTGWSPCGPSVDEPALQAVALTRSGVSHWVVPKKPLLLPLETSSISEGKVRSKRQLLVLASNKQQGCKALTTKPSSCLWWASATNCLDFILTKSKNSSFAPMMEFLFCSQNTFHLVGLPDFESKGDTLHSFLIQFHWYQRTNIWSELQPCKYFQYKRWFISPSLSLDFSLFSFSTGGDKRIPVVKDPF